MNDELLILLKPVIQERIEKLSDIKNWLVPFMTEPECDLEDLKYKSIYNYLEVNKILNTAVLILEETAWAPFRANVIETSFRMRASNDGVKAGEFFFPIRVAITGSKVSLPLFETMEALGKEKVIQRLKAVIKRLEEANGRNLHKQNPWNGN